MSKEDDLLMQLYRKWALSHTPTWETDNLVGNLLGWPEWYMGLMREHQDKTFKKVIENLKAAFPKTGRRFKKR